MANHTLSPQAVPCQFDLTDILHQLMLITGDQTITSSDIKGRWVWGRPGGGIHIEVLFSDPAVSKSAMLHLTPDDYQLPRRDRWKIFRERQLDTAQCLNIDAVRKGKLVLLLKKNGEPTSKFKALMKFFPASPKNYLQ